MKHDLAILFYLLLTFSSSFNYAADKSTFTYADLVSIIQEKKLKSVESTLPFFPESMRKNFVLMRNSFSLQKANDLYPRAILFGLDATLTCSFGGHESLDGYDSFECYQFDKNTASFEFREIAFPSAENGLEDVAFSIPNRQAVGTINCNGCHNLDPRPNWEPYSRWPGAYGSFDDSFNLGTEDERSRNLNPAATNSQLQTAISEELNAFKKFKLTVKDSSRYSQLLFNESDLSPFSNEFKSLNFDFRPNVKLTHAIGRLMVLRNLRKLGKFSINNQLDFVKAVLKCQSPFESSMNWLRPSYETADVLIKLNLFPFDWTAGFRSLNPNCKDCENNGGDPDQNRASSISNYIYETGDVDVNSIMAARLVEKWVKAGMLPQKSLDVSLIRRGLEIDQQTQQTTDSLQNQMRLELCTNLETQKE